MYIYKLILIIMPILHSSDCNNRSCILGALVCEKNLQTKYILQNCNAYTSDIWSPAFNVSLLCGWVSMMQYQRQTACFLFSLCCFLFVCLFVCFFVWFFFFVFFFCLFFPATWAVGLMVWPSYRMCAQHSSKRAARGWNILWSVLSLTAVSI